MLSNLPRLVPYYDLRRDPEVWGFAQHLFGGTEVHHVLHAVSLCCLPVLPDGHLPNGKSVLSGCCLLYAEQLDRERDVMLGQPWTMTVELGASAYWRFVPATENDWPVMEASDCEPLSQRVMDLLDRSHWLVLRTPVQARAFMA